MGRFLKSPEIRLRFQHDSKLTAMGRGRRETRRRPREPKSRGGPRGQTPAMASGLAKRAITIGELLEVAAARLHVSKDYRHVDQKPHDDEQWKPQPKRLIFEVPCK